MIENMEEKLKSLMLEEELKAELEAYMKALEIACSDIAAIDNELCSQTANDMDYWYTFYITKARRKENE